MNWDNLKFFLAIARDGSARAASSSTNISHSTITRRVDQLESVLGTKLFDRVPSGYTLTTAGKDVYQIAKKIEADIHDIERRLTGQDSQLHGTIRFTVPNHFMTIRFMNYIRDFSEMYKEIDIDVVPSYETFNLNRREADVALRIFKPGAMPADNLVGSKVIDIYSANYCSADYLSDHDLEDPESACWIGWSDKGRFPDWVKESAFPHLPARHFLNDARLQLEAVKADLGITMLPCFMCDLDDELIRIPENHTWLNFEAWLLSHPDLRDTTRFQVFRQFLRDCFHKDAALWRGDCYDK